MTQIIASLASIQGRYRAVLCDLWGCLHNGVAAFPEAVAALRGFRATGGKVILLTNAPRPKPPVVAQLDRLGVPRDAWDEVVTSGDAAQYALLTGAVGRRVYHLGPEKDLTFFTEFADDLQAIRASEPPIDRVPLDQAEGIVCTGLFDDLTETPDDYRATLLFAKTKGLKMLCANPDIMVDLGEKRIFCAGALAQAYEEMGGEALYFGKPHPPIYDLARRRLAAMAGVLPDDEILCIGDGIGTDIRGGQGEGLDTLFVTGGLAAGLFGPDAPPDAQLLEAWLAEQGQNPTFTAPSLR
ncbi:TIGR01459 family HAD-type hydrolase [Aliigemmobacter aestuarii]|uniref:TIGR01459 family HAD-type hydrolase n=1 Tax=Aliigemmobacter aestuarii TaxID=1445661 RepID=A0A4S3MTW0_9RHOB|nr:TIGR01459 family HAD-type hydrolase [Gemmobacter aestuarii]THD84951.1 TIGR01459 family HAD-type hydrolase [Gemmobacter aestuarii]